MSEPTAIDKIAQEAGRTPRASVALLSWCHTETLPAAFCYRLMEWYQSVVSGREDTEIAVTLSPMFRGNAYLPASREQMADNFMERYVPLGIEYLLMVDVDMTWPHNAIQSLAIQGKDIISARCHTRSEPYTCTARRRGQDGQYRALIPTPLSGSFKVDVAGAGFLMIHKRVFERTPKPWFLPSPPYEGLSEDYYFCMHAADSGFETWYDFGIDISHWTMAAVGRAHGDEFEAREMVKGLQIPLDPTRRR